MLSRRLFLLGATAAALPLQAARANVPAPYDWDASPPTSSREVTMATRNAPPFTLAIPAALPRHARLAAANSDTVSPMPR